MNKLKILFFLLVFLNYEKVFSRDIFYISRTQLSGFNTQVTEIGFGLPPIGPRELMWGNGFSTQDWTDNLRGYTLFKWSPSIIKKIDDSRTLIIAKPYSWSSESRSFLLSEKAKSTTLIASISNKNPENLNWSWSYGLLVFDETNQNLIYPIFGFSYTNDSQTWKYNVGYPNVAVIYLGLAPDEISIYFSRESSKVLLQSSVSSYPDARYIDENLNLIGLSYKMSIQNIYRLNFKMGTSFSSKFQFLNANYDHIGIYHDHSGESFMGVAFSLDFAPNKKP